MSSSWMSSLALLVTLMFSSLVAGQQFQAPAYYQVGPSNSEPMGITSADFNHDGSADLAVALYYSDQIMILLNTGTGSFQKPITISLPSGPVAIVNADLNQDGNPDLLVVTSIANQPSILGIYLGVGDGTFTHAGNYHLGEYAGIPGVADFNGDGRLDVAVPNSISGGLMVFTGDGQGHLSGPTIYKATNGPTAVAAADLNGDGHIDLAVAGGKNSLAILLNNGSGGFGSPVNYQIGGESASIAVGDLNHDGKLDLAVACSFSQAMYVLLGNGDGSFGSATVYPTSSIGNAPFSAVFADFNLDGNLDMAVLMFQETNAAVALFYGNGDGTFQNPVGIVLNNAGPSMTLGDFDKNGAPDLGVAMLGGGHVAVLLNSQ